VRKVTENGQWVDGSGGGLEGGIRKEGGGREQGVRRSKQVQGGWQGGGRGMKMVG